MKSTDIILLTCNRINFLKQCIKALEEKLSTPFSLIVINNNSKDGTTEYLEELKLKSDYKIQLIFNENPPKLSGCYTQGLEYVTTDYFVCLQDDIIIPDLEPDVLSRMIKLIDAYPEYGGITLRKPNMRGNWSGEVTRTKTAGAGFRIHKTKEWRDVGFGNRRWETLATKEMATKIGKLVGVATDMWLKDLGYIKDRGYPGWYINEMQIKNSYEWIKKQPKGMNSQLIKLEDKTNKPI